MHEQASLQVVALGVSSNKHVLDIVTVESIAIP